MLTQAPPIAVNAIIRVQTNRQEAELIHNMIGQVIEDKGYALRVEVFGFGFYLIGKDEATLHLGG